MSRRDKSHNLAVGVITRELRRKRDTETFGGNDRFRGPGRPENYVSVGGRETRAERAPATQVIAETCVKTRKAGASCLGLRVLTRGYRIVRYAIFSGGDRIRTCDLEVMSLASYRTAPPRVMGCRGQLPRDGVYFSNISAIVEGKASFLSRFAFRSSRGRGFCPGFRLRLPQSAARRARCACAFHGVSIGCSGHRIVGFR
jgi:hypothetical protein